MLINRKHGPERDVIYGYVHSIQEREVVVYPLFYPLDLKA